MSGLQSPPLSSKKEERIPYLPWEIGLGVRDLSLSRLWLIWKLTTMCLYLEGFRGGGRSKLEDAWEKGRERICCFILNAVLFLF